MQLKTHWAYYSRQRWLHRLLCCHMRRTYFVHQLQIATTSLNIYITSQQHLLLSLENELWQLEDVADDLYRFWIPFAPVVEPPALVPACTLADLLLEDAWPPRLSKDLISCFDDCGLTKPLERGSCDELDEVL